MRELRWYTTLAVWKSVVFMEGNYKRAQAGMTDDPYLEQFGEGVLQLAAHAEEVALGEQLKPLKARRSAGLLVDWGGVMTTNLFASFSAFCEAEGLDPAALAQAFRGDPAARELLIGFEKGSYRSTEFEEELGRLLGVDG